MSTLSLADLCSNGNLEDVRQALARGEDVNKVDQDGRTGLMWAVYYTQNAIVELLLSQPSLDVNLVNCDGWTALHYACHFAKVKGLKMLMAHPGTNSHNVKDHGGWTPLMKAAGNNSMDCIRELLKVDGLDLDTGFQQLCVEVRRLIDEEKQRREMEEVKTREKAAMLKREEEAKKEKEVLKVRRLVDEETEKKMMRVVEDCAKLLKMGRGSAKT